PVARIGLEFSPQQRLRFAAVQSDDSEYSSEISAESVRCNDRRTDRQEPAFCFFQLRGIAQPSGGGKPDDHWGAKPGRTQRRFFGRIEHGPDLQPVSPDRGRPTDAISE